MINRPEQTVDSMFSFHCRKWNILARGEFRDLLGFLCEHLRPFVFCDVRIQPAEDFSPASSVILSRAVLYLWYTKSVQLRLYNAPLKSYDELKTASCMTYRRMNHGRSRESPIPVHTGTYAQVMQMRSVRQVRSFSPIISTRCNCQVHIFARTRQAHFTLRPS